MQAIDGVERIKQRTGIVRQWGDKMVERGSWLGGVSFRCTLHNGQGINKLCEAAVGPGTQCDRSAFIDLFPDH